MKNKKTEKLLDCISIVLFFLIISVAGITTLIFNGGSVEKLIKNPDINAAEEFVHEGFPLKKNLNQLYSKTASLTGQRVFNEIYLDKDNDRLVKIFPQPEKDDITSATERINSFHEKYKEVPTYIMLVPTASGIYRSDMPEYTYAADQQKLIDDIYYKIDAEITPLDVFNALYSSRNRYIYFRTDKHWTQLGAYEAYNSAAPKLGLYPYTLTNYDLDYTHVYFSGSLSEESSINAITSDTITAYRCKYGSYVKKTEIITKNEKAEKKSVYSAGALQNNSKYSYYLGYEGIKYASIQTTNDDLPSLLIISSDYANCFVPFLAPHYSEIVIVNPQMLGENETLEDYAAPEKFSQILFLYDTESFFDNTDISDTQK